jgi:UDPglucose--hexose-1-phosphate uridylyltransferase
MSEIRENRLTGEWVIIAPERAKRGGNFASAPERMVVPPFLASCMFCPGNEAMAADERFRFDGEDGQWVLRSVVNKFSVLSSTGEVARTGCAAPGEVSVNGVGLHEVLIESPRHDVTMALYPVAHVQRILEAYRHRFLEFYRDPRVRHVIVFKNHGVDAGASQQHAHSQIVGIPIVPGQVVERIERARRFLSDSGQCLACTLIAQEREQACRIVAENAEFVAFIPHAALSPYHLWIFPKTHAFRAIRRDAARTGGGIANCSRKGPWDAGQSPLFNLVVRSLGPQEKDSTHFHWYISIVPRVNKRAGFELGTGMYINPSSPESCAKALREFGVPAG